LRKFGVDASYVGNRMSIVGFDCVRIDARSICVGLRVCVCDIELVEKKEGGKSIYGPGKSLRWWRCSTDLHGGEAHARTKRLEIEPAGLDLTVETAPEICYICQ